MEPTVHDGEKSLRSASERLETLHYPGHVSHTTREMQSPPVLTTLPPPTLDERSRELCVCSTLLLWRAQRACENSKQLRERIRRRKNVSRIEQG